MIVGEARREDDVEGFAFRSLPLRKNMRPTIGAGAVLQGVLEQAVPGLGRAHKAEFSNRRLCRCPGKGPIKRVTQQLCPAQLNLPLILGNRIKHPGKNRDSSADAAAFNLGEDMIEAVGPGGVSLRHADRVRQRPSERCETKVQKL